LNNAKRCLVLFVITILTLVPHTACPLEKVRVAVLPFEVHSAKDLAYMQAEIAGIIKKHLKRDGAVVMDLELKPELKGAIAAGVGGIRNLGVESGADYIVWGSLTWIGQQFSMDAKMIETFVEAPPNIFFVEGKSIETLLGIVKELADKIGMKIFKREKVAEVRIKDNKRIESDAILKLIKTAPGDIMLAQSLSDDLKAVYSMGYFDDIRIEAEDGTDGKIITFRIKEKPNVRKVRLEGNRHIDDEDIQEVLAIRTGSILNINTIHDSVKQIEDLYKEKKYHNVKTTYNIEYLENNQAAIKFVIEEGEKVRIKRIIFEGNTAYKDKKLTKMMETSEKGFFSWLTSSGDLNMDNLNQDIAKLAAFYHNSGYIQAKVGEPAIKFKENWIYITIKIDEGSRFEVGNVDIAGDLIFPKEELLEKLKITKETFFNREVVRNDVLALTDFYADEGYAYAEIAPRVYQDAEKLIVNITYDVKKNKQVYFEAIIISGNTKTRDKVIRRELKVFEQELYNGKGLKRGVRNLYRLDYFEEVKVNTLQGSSDDKMVLKIDVVEKPTGAFTFGGGYSSVENAFVMVSTSQRNLFGRGQTLEVTAELGGRTTQYNLSFTEPWLFDIPLSAGFRIFKLDRDYDEYDKESFGGSVWSSYPVFDYTRATVQYGYENADIKNIELNASDSINELEGTNVESSITTGLQYDSRNSLFNATDGSKHSISVQYAGLGGDIGFTKYLAETGWFIPLYKDLVGVLHGKTGYVAGHPGKILPDWERFYLGGINSLRGFDYRDISPTEINANGLESKVGGDKFIQINIELKHPLFKDAGIWGVAFFDTGNVYNNDENYDLSNMRESVGYGFRWYSPVGPIRFEYGHILDPEEGRGEGGRWEFTMGGVFF
jgi:outer membrane protein insertion porin family